MTTGDPVDFVYHPPIKEAKSFCEARLCALHKPIICLTFPLFFLLLPRCAACATCTLKSIKRGPTDPRSLHRLIENPSPKYIMAILFHLFFLTSLLVNARITDQRDDDSEIFDARWNHLASQSNNQGNLE